MDALNDLPADVFSASCDEPGDNLVSDTRTLKGGTGDISASDFEQHTASPANSAREQQHTASPAKSACNGDGDGTLQLQPLQGDGLFVAQGLTLGSLPGQVLALAFASDAEVKSKKPGLLAMFKAVGSRFSRTASKERNIKFKLAAKDLVVFKSDGDTDFLDMSTISVTKFEDLVALLVQEHNLTDAEQQCMGVECGYSITPAASKQKLPIQSTTALHYNYPKDEALNVCMEASHNFDHVVWAFCFKYTAKKPDKPRALIPTGIAMVSTKNRTVDHGRLELLCRPPEKLD